MPFPSYRYTLTNGRVIDDSKLNGNFSDIVDSLSDGTKNLKVNDAIVTGELNAASNIVLDGASVMASTLSVAGQTTLNGAVSCSDDVTVKRVGFTAKEENTINTSGAITPTKSYIDLIAQIYETSDFSSIEITLGVNDKLDFNEGSGELTATITAGTYIPTALATEIETQLNAVGSLLWTCTYDSDDEEFTISVESSSSILWNSGTNSSTTIGKAIGFDVMSDDSSATSFTSDYPYEIDYTDELATITATNFDEGSMVILKKSSSSASNTITLKDVTGNLNVGSDRSMSDNSRALLLYDGTNWNLVA